LRIAVIGSGISGLLSAYLLQQQHEVVLLEKSDRLGGHTRTLRVSDKGRDIPVDTGFIVFNRETYPVLWGLFEHLHVPKKSSDMSFGVSLDSGRVEYGTVPLKALFAQKKQLFSQSHWRMLSDIKRFNRQALELLSTEGKESLGEFLQQNNYAASFIKRFILPMAASIWSSAPSEIMSFPARHLIRFFDNHGLLDPEHRKQWFTVDGGSQVYIDKVLADYRGEYRTGVDIDRIERSDAGVDLRYENGEQESFDQVVLACHSDQALKLLGDSVTETEQQVLSQIGYQSNEVILHSDSRLMPKNRNCWQSWNYISESESYGEPRVCLSYWMNRLQSIQSSQPLIVSLNPEKRPSPDLVYDVWHTEHPIFDQAAIDAQVMVKNIQGKNRIWFAGAWQSYGFHEDGAASALRVAQALGCELPWSSQECA
jgi:uncharacterized protein